MVLQQFCSCSSVKTWETHKTNHLFLFLSKQLDWSHSLTLHHLSFFQWDGSFLWLINRTTRQIWNKTKYEWTGIQINTSVQSLECTARKTTTRSKQSTSGCLDAEAQQVAQSSHTWRVWFWTRLVIFQPWQLYLQCEIWTQFEKESSLVLRKNRNFLHTHTGSWPDQRQTLNSGVVENQWAAQSAADLFPSDLICGDFQGQVRLRLHVKCSVPPGPCHWAAFSKWTLVGSSVRLETGSRQTEDV